MKKIMFFAAIAAVVSLASCQKEALNEAAGTESPVFTATISTGTKTTVNATDGKVAWESTDKITITDASAAAAIYKIKSIDGNTGKATFEVESGTLGQGPYTATYGTAPTTAQTYRATPGNLYMTASSETTTLTFSVQCGLMEINLTKAGESVMSIAVTGTPTGGSETTYTLTCTDAQSIAAETSFYISVAAGSYNKIVITDNEDKVCTLTAASGITVAANHIKPLTFKDSKLNFKSNLPDGALSGKFSVSNDNGANVTQILFSQGNLYYDGSKFNFEANQYSFKDSWDATHVSHFYWSKEPNEAIEKDYNPEQEVSGDDVFFTNKNETTAKASFTVNVNGKDQTGWRTLSTKEWQYLFNTRTMENGGDRYTPNITYGGKMGVVLYPDDYSGSTLTSGTDYTDANFPKNCVFLPAAGQRDHSSVEYVGDYGNYWSSTAYDESNAYLVYFDSSDVPHAYDSRSIGYSVRLVTEASVTPAPTPTTTGTAKATIGGNEVDVNWVQLWENGPKFAEYNVGVTDGNAESYGGYYTWGGTYNNDPNLPDFLWTDDHNTGFSELSHTGDDITDTATNLWGGNWRMPTQTELQGLIDNCDVEWMDGSTKKYNNTTVKGLLCKGKDAYESNSVFLPAAGFCFFGGAVSQGDDGHYWSSTPNGSDYAFDLYFDSGDQDVYSNSRNYGYSVRAVLAEK